MPSAPTPSVSPEPAPRKRRWGKMYLGLFLVILGGLFFAQSMGWISVVWDWSRVWPLLIILAGLSILGGHSVGMRALSFVLLLLVIVFFIGMSARPWSQRASAVDEQINVAMPAEVTQAEITADFGASTVTIDAAEGAALTGRMRSQGGMELVQSMSGTTSTVQIDEKSVPGPWFWHMGWPSRELTLHIPAALPTTLGLDTGASTVRVDGRKMQLTRLDIDAGASTIDVALGDLVAQAAVTIDAGASTIRVSVPRSLGVRVVTDGGLSTRNMGDLQQQGEDTYVSENYDTAEKKAEVTITSGVSTITVVRE